MRKEINWISLKDQKPDIGLNVDLIGNDWRSSGWLTEKGFWSIAHAKNVTILSKPTHWCIIKSLGRPKSPQTKKAFSLRLSNDVIDIIRSKPNQAAYIEDLVRNNPITLNKE